MRYEYLRINTDSGKKNIGDSQIYTTALTHTYSFKKKFYIFVLRYLNNVKDG